MNKVGIFISHYGWTDIFNCLALIDYYLETYNQLYVIYPIYSKDIINFYIKNKNVIPIYVNVRDNRIIAKIFSNKQQFKQTLIEYNIVTNNIPDNKDIDLLFHGMNDIYREDKYINLFGYNLNKFVNRFYTLYDINYDTRYKFFNIVRDYHLENKIYLEFINKYGKNYILHHEINEINEPSNNNYSIINLNCITNTYFDYIKVLENAKEIHVLDSSWGAFIYLLDARYKLFNNIKISVYCKRNYNWMFEEPIKLENWKII